MPLSPSRGAHASILPRSRSFELSARVNESDGSAAQGGVNGVFGAAQTSPFFNLGAGQQLQPQPQPQLQQQQQHSRLNTAPPLTGPAASYVGAQLGSALVDMLQRPLTAEQQRMAQGAGAQQVGVQVRSRLCKNIMSSMMLTAYRGVDRCADAALGPVTPLLTQVLFSGDALVPHWAATLHSCIYGEVMRAYLPCSVQDATDELTKVYPVIFHNAAHGPPPHVRLIDIMCIRYVHRTTSGVLYPPFDQRHCVVLVPLPNKVRRIEACMPGDVTHEVRMLSSTDPAQTMNTVWSNTETLIPPAALDAVDDASSYNDYLLLTLPDRRLACTSDGLIVLRGTKARLRLGVLLFGGDVADALVANALEKLRKDVVAMLIASWGTMNRTSLPQASVSLPELRNRYTRAVMHMHTSTIDAYACMHYGCRM